LLLIRSHPRLRPNPNIRNVHSGRSHTRPAFPLPGGGCQVFASQVFASGIDVRVAICATQLNAGYVRRLGRMPIPDSCPPASGPDHLHSGGSGHPAEAPFNQEFWDQRYQSNRSVWSGDPNTHLVSEAADLTPGTALDVGTGEGADALWLANRGWQVTATDISTVALDRAAGFAREAGVEVAARINWLHADMTCWVPDPMAYDLVSAQYMHLATPQRDAMVARLAASVAGGGTLLMVGHHPFDLQTTVPRPPRPELFFTAAQIADALNPKQWDILVSDARPRTATDPDGRPVTIHDAVLRAQRHRT
jgi:SAM-dependent methyltransferase